MNNLKLAFRLLRQPHLLKPSLRISRVTALTEEHLEGVTALVFDKDDTLCPHGSYRPPDDIEQKLADLSRRYICVVVSNDPQLDTSQKVGRLPILKTRKSKPNNFEEILFHLMQMDKTLSQNQNIAFVGDRLLTDIYMANANGCRSILVEPLEPATLRKHGFWVCFFRRVESLLL